MANCAPYTHNITKLVVWKFYYVSTILWKQELNVCQIFWIAYEEFCRDAENAPKKRGRKAVIYRLTYDDMAGVLRINDIIVHKCNIESELDKAIRKALRAPGKSAVIYDQALAALKSLSLCKN